MLTGVRQTPEKLLLLDVPVPLTAEQGLNFHLPLIQKILEHITSEYTSENSEVFISGTPDTLNRTDYPVIHKLFFEYLRKSRKISKFCELPMQTTLRRYIPRDPLTDQEATDHSRKTIVIASRNAPLCFRFAVMEDAVHLGDVFLIPVITKRIASQAFIENNRRVSYDVVVATIDAEARKAKRRSGRRKNDTIFVTLTAQYEDPVNPIGFSFLADTLTNNNANILNFGEMMTHLINEWRELQYNISKRNLRRR